jgi:SAM-dependent methyltransferase
MEVGMSVGEWILTAMSRDPGTPDYAGGTATTTLDNALDFLEKTVPNFREMTRDRSVLDFGCGLGLQAAALARLSPTARVVGVDLPRPILQERWRQYDAPNLTLTTELPDGELFDIVYSCSSFEHFADPAHILTLMCARAKPNGGLVIVSFAEPWFSPHGSHMDGFTRLPWVNLLFTEKTVLKVRSRYRSDGARRYEDVEGGLNRMTVARFERLMRGSGMRIQSLRLFPVKGLPVVSHIPVVRELMTAAASCVLQRTDSDGATTRR